MTKSIVGTSVKEYNNIYLLLFVILIILAIGALYYRLIFQFEQLDSLDQQIKNQLQILQTKDINISNSQVKKNRISQYTNITETIFTMINTVKLYDLDIQNIVWENPTPISVGNDENIIYETSLDLSFIGTYDNVCGFIESIKKAETIYNLKGIQISTDNVNTKSFVKAKLSISSYAMEQILQGTYSILNNNFLIKEKGKGSDSFYYQE